MPATPPPSISRPRSSPHAERQQSLVLQPGLSVVVCTRGVRAMGAADGVEDRALGLEEVARRIAPRFVRAGPHRRALAYLRGLMAPSGRKNGRQLAEAAGGATPDGVQDLLPRMR